MSTIPFDSTIRLLREGYPFISSRCDAEGTDLFTTRIGLRPVTFLRGADAAALFYDGHHMSRQGAMPHAIQHLLQDEGSVQSLDGAAHARRKRAFLSLMTPAAMTRLGDLFEEEWERAAQNPGQRRSRLDAVVRPVLTRAALRWAGIPLERADAERLSADLSLMVERVAQFGPPNWHARWRRRGVERWAAELVQSVRASSLSPEKGTALEVFAHHTDEHGELLDPRTAAVELLNILRPILAVSLFVEFAAVALIEHPQWRRAFAAGDEDDLEPFVQEVRRYYPFFPAVPGRVRTPFTWRGHSFRAGDRVILDLYGTCHDPRLFPDPDAFRPERFRGWSWEEHPDTLIAQGAGRHDADHRCPGEWSTVELLERAVRLLSRSDASAPAQDLTFRLDRFPTRPRSGVVLNGL
ncbi:cytochrome P450 [Brachybacterium sp. NPDC056505]|uniref:cytochrome P450 n=1 Tax=Brachybacterium sp. NPDC056505 TaxID=3345843 RepID=UPI0036720C87